MALGLLLVQADDEVTRVYVEQSSLTTLRDLLVGSGLECRSTQLVHVPKVLVDCTDEDFESNMLAIEALEALDDVDSCEHNSKYVHEAGQTRCEPFVHWASLQHLAREVHSWSFLSTAFVSCCDIFPVSDEE